MCLLVRVRGKKLQKRFAGCTPAANKERNNGKLGEFPASGQSRDWFYVPRERSMVMRCRGHRARLQATIDVCSLHVCNVFRDSTRPETEQFPLSFQSKGLPSEMGLNPFRERWNVRWHAFIARWYSIQRTSQSRSRNYLIIEPQGLRYCWFIVEEVSTKPTSR